MLNCRTFNSREMCCSVVLARIFAGNLQSRKKVLLFMMQRGSSKSFRKCIFPKCLLTSDKSNPDFALRAGGVVGV